MYFQTTRDLWRWTAANREFQEHPSALTAQSAAVGLALVLRIERRALPVMGKWPTCSLRAPARFSLSFPRLSPVPRLHSSGLHYKGNCRQQKSKQSYHIYWLKDRCCATVLVCATGEAVVPTTGGLLQDCTYSFFNWSASNALLVQKDN